MCDSFFSFFKTNLYRFEMVENFWVILYNTLLHIGLQKKSRWLLVHAYWFIPFGKYRENWWRLSNVPVYLSSTKLFFIFKSWDFLQFSESEFLHRPTAVFCKSLTPGLSVFCGCSPSHSCGPCFNAIVGTSFSKCRPSKDRLYRPFYEIFLDQKNYWIRDVPLTKSWFAVYSLIWINWGDRISLSRFKKKNTCAVINLLVENKVRF